MFGRRTPEQQEARILEGLELDRQFGVGQDLSPLQTLKIRPSGAEDWDWIPDRSAFAESRKYLAAIGLAVVTMIGVGLVINNATNEQQLDPASAIEPQANN